MLWRSRVLFTDRQQGLAQLAAAAAEHRVVLVSVRMFRSWQGRPADDVVLHPPAGWGPARVHAFLLAAGAASVKVLPAPHHGDLSREDVGEWSARLAHPANGGRPRDRELMVG